MIEDNDEESTAQDFSNKHPEALEGEEITDQVIQNLPNIDFGAMKQEEFEYEGEKIVEEANPEEKEQFMRQ